MLSVTFLGHQGWLFQTKSACILVDPLLCEDFGQAHALEYRVFPPRIWKLESLPPLDAVVLTHEHDDHFDLPSLAKLDRKIPIFLSSRSSSAARTILGEMGFSVQPLRPGHKVKFQDLEFWPFTGDHVSVDCGDEWDTLPFFVRDSGGSGNFFSMVDITLTEQHVDLARKIDARPVIIGWTNNALDWSYMADYLDDRVEATQECFVKMGVGHKLITTRWGTPSAMLMCAGGFSFTGEREPLNRRVFCVDTTQVCQMMARLYKGQQFHATRPGQTFEMGGHRLRQVLESAPFLSTPSDESWPSREKTDGEIPDYSPATGLREIHINDMEPALNELAGSLVGGTLWRSLHSLYDEEHKATFAFVLRNGGERHVYEYVPEECRFAPGSEEQAYAGRFECWAADLLAVLRGDMSAITLNFGRARLWNALPTKFRFAIFPELHRMSHPLRRPAAALENHRRLWAACRETAPTVKGK
jgi:L-ascorbate metabolism protein UlaG (beta-lactamase superfamily)